MKVTLIKDLQKEYKDLGGKEICVAGWVKSVRANGSIGFIDLNDGTAFKGLQVVFDAKLENYDVVEKLNTGSSVVCSGKLVLTPEGKQPYEMQAQSVEVVSATDNEYPLQKKRHSIEFLRDLAYLRPRTNTFNAVFRINVIVFFTNFSYFITFQIFFLT